MTEIVEASPVSQMNPAVKNSLVGMRRQIDLQVTEPAALTRAEYHALSPQDRQLFDESRVRWFGSGFLLKSEASTDLLHSVRGYLAMRDLDAVGSQGVSVLTGPANVGKSTTLLQLAKEVEARAERRTPGFRADGRVPVVFIEMLPGATPKGVATSILDFFAVPHRNREAHQVLVRQAAEVMVRRRVSLLIVDEFHVVQLEGKRGDDAINAVKAIINNTGVVTVLAGIDLDVQLGSRAAEQLIARGEVHRYNPFDYASEASRRSWAGLVAAFGQQMRLLDGPPDLARYADSLHAVTAGRIGPLRRILSFALMTMLESKIDDPAAPEVLTDEHLAVAARQQVKATRKPKNGRAA